MRRFQNEAYLLTEPHLLLRLNQNEAFFVIYPERDIY